MEKTVYFLTGDGIKLCGTLTVAKEDADTCVILCHGIGYGRNMEKALPVLARLLVKQGFSVLRFDFRGHGDSAGESIEFTIGGQLKDIKAAADWVMVAGYKKLGLVGASMGGGAAVLFVAKHPKTFAALALLNPVVDYMSLLGLKTAWSKKYFGPRAMMDLDVRGFAKIGSRGFKIGRSLIAEMKTFQPWRELKKIKIPVLFVHGDADEAVCIEDSIKYSKVAKNAALAVITGGGHGLYNSSAVLGETVRTIADFMIKNLK